MLSKESNPSQLRLQIVSRPRVSSCPLLSSRIVGVLFLKFHQSIKHQTEGFRKQAMCIVTYSPGKKNDQSVYLPFNQLQTSWPHLWHINEFCHSSSPLLSYMNSVFCLAIKLESLISVSTSNLGLMVSNNQETGYRKDEKIL